MSLDVGVHTIDAKTYHADPCELPSLTASIANVLVTRAPIHAWTQHPRLNPDYENEESERFDIGTAAHALLLEGSTAVEVVAAKDWRTNGAQDARAEARAAGRLPLLEKHWSGVQAMVEAARIQLRALHDPPTPFTDGQPEQTLVWKDERGPWCRARIDWIHNDGQTIDDYKTTGRSANPEDWSRTLFGMGCDVQAAFYLRGLRALTGVDAHWRWVVQETATPYALSVLSLAPAALELATAKVERALDIWHACQLADVWPGYAAQVCYADLPPWEETRWLEREEQDELPVPAG